MGDLSTLIPQRIELNNDQVHNAISVDDRESRLSVRQKIDAFERALQCALGSDTGSMDEINEQGLTHHQMPGVYVRELFIPAGTVMVSKLHKKVRMWIIAKGAVTFRTEMGARRVEGPYTEIVPPWSKVALVTHSDTTWFAIHKAEGESLTELENELIAQSWGEEVQS